VVGAIFDTNTSFDSEEQYMNEEPEVITRYEHMPAGIIDLQLE
jgi:hypothetical protein